MDHRRCFAVRATSCIPSLHAHTAASDDPEIAVVQNLNVSPAIENVDMRVAPHHAHCLLLVTRTMRCVACRVEVYRCRYGSLLCCPILTPISIGTATSVPK